MTITFLDGGMGQELVARAGKATSLWSVQALLDNPEMVTAVHNEYFMVGADVVTTYTYSILPDRLDKIGLADQFELLQILACQLATAHRDLNGTGIVAGSLGPQGFSYQPELTPPADMAAEIQSRICKIQANHVDVFIAETMSSVDQAKGALMGASGFNKPIWLALSVDDRDGTKLRSGEDLKDILPLLNEYKPAAVMINCSAPEAVSIALPLLSEANIPTGGYANGFVEIAKNFNKIGATVDLLKARTDLNPEAYANIADDWIKSGATFILSLIHISEPTRLRRISYAVFCLKKKNKKKHIQLNRFTLI